MTFLGTKKATRCRSVALKLLFLSEVFERHKSVVVLNRLPEIAHVYGDSIFSIQVKSLFGKAFLGEFNVMITKHQVKT